MLSQPAMLEWNRFFSYSYLNSENNRVQDIEIKVFTHIFTAYIEREVNM